VNYLYGQRARWNLLVQMMSTLVLYQQVNGVEQLRQLLDLIEHNLLFVGVPRAVPIILARLLRASRTTTPPQRRIIGGNPRIGSKLLN
jgi:hypothetical protein